MRTLLLVLATLTVVGCGRHQNAARMQRPALPPMMRQQVVNAVSVGEGNVRVRRLRERLATEPRNVAVRLELAAEYGAMGYPELELEHCRIAVERFPESAAAVERLAKSLRQAGSPQEAAAMMAKLVEQQEQPSLETLAWAGILLDEASRLRDGEAMHRRAIAADARRDYLHNNLGYNLLLQERYPEAADAFRRALELNSGSATARNNLGRTLVQMNPNAPSPDAVAQFQRAADLAIAHNNIATELYEKGDVAGARKELEIALEYRRDVPQILENLRMVAEDDGQPIAMPQARSSVWRKLGHGIKVAFGAPDVRQKTGTADAAR
jgi:tetratricopeptide (TPR) repeat protein